MIIIFAFNYSLRKCSNRSVLWNTLMWFRHQFWLSKYELNRCDIVLELRLTNFNLYNLIDNQSLQLRYYFRIWSFPQLSPILNEFLDIIHFYLTTTFSRRAFSWFFQLFLKNIFVNRILKSLWRLWFYVLSIEKQPFWSQIHDLACHFYANSKTNTDPRSHNDIRCDLISSNDSYC